MLTWRELLAAGRDTVQATMYESLYLIYERRFESVVWG